VVATDTEVQALELVGERWTPAVVAASGPIATIEPAGYPPVALWTGDRLVVGGAGGLLAWTPSDRTLDRLDDRRVVTFGATAVWTGTEVVALSNQNTEGWVWTPAPAPG
jgi:hypothetical protein